MDGLSIAGSVIAVVQLADRVITLCSRFIEHVKDAEEQAKQAKITVLTLKGVLEAVHALVDKNGHAAQSPRLRSLCAPDGAVDACSSLLEKVELKLQLKRDYHGILKTLSWPFKWRDTLNMLNEIEQQKTLMMLAMQMDATHSTLEIIRKLDTIETQSNVENHRQILKWLTKVDPGSNHTAARAKHEPGTCKWFVESREYSFWMLPQRTLWLHGIPGAGKTILCSTVIENLKSRQSQRISCLYYYFDFSDLQKQKPVNILYSFLAQLSVTDVPSEVQQLYKQCGLGTQEVTNMQLIDVIVRIARRLNSQNHRIFLVVDALDECFDRNTLLEILRMICEKKQVNLLVTSRQESDIDRALTGLVHFLVPIQDEQVNNDIHLHVQQCLTNDGKLSKLHDNLKSSVIETLTSKANGMFQWVECQLETLRRCSRPSTLYRALNSLPETLDRTYERILSNIPKESYCEAQIVFALLICSPRPISLAEAAEATAVNLETESFDKNDRLFDPLSICEICSSFLKLVPFPSQKYSLGPHGNGGDKSLQFAHYSVEEYLRSERAPEGFKFTAERAFSMISRISLIYMLSIDNNINVDLRLTEAFPFVMYAAEFWVLHVRSLQITRHLRILVLVLRLIDKANAARLERVLRALRRGEPSGIVPFTRYLPIPFVSPLHHAACFGIFEACKYLIENGADVTARNNHWRKKGWTALHEAAASGYLEIVKLLVEEGNVDVDVRTLPGDETCLHSAAVHGALEVVKWLVNEAKADVNARTGAGHTALYWATISGQPQIVEWLVKDGNADIEAATTRGVPVRQTAIELGQLRSAKSLLEKPDTKQYPGGLKVLGF